MFFVACLPALPPPLPLAGSPLGNDHHTAPWPYLYPASTRPSSVARLVIPPCTLPQTHSHKAAIPRCKISNLKSQGCCSRGFSLTNPPYRAKKPKEAKHIKFSNSRILAKQPIKALKSVLLKVGKRFPAKPFKPSYIMYEVGDPPDPQQHHRRRDSTEQFYYEEMLM